MSLQSQEANVEKIVITAQELLRLFSEIQSKGMPPHTDFWHQSIWEREQALREAIAIWQAGIP